MMQGGNFGRQGWSGNQYTGGYRNSNMNNNMMGGGGGMGMGMQSGFMGGGGRGMMGGNMGGMMRQGMGMQGMGRGGFDQSRKRPRQLIDNRDRRDGQKRGGPPPTKKVKTVGFKGYKKTKDREMGKTYCVICSLDCWNEKAYEQHIRGRRHKMKIDGKEVSGPIEDERTKPFCKFCYITIKEDNWAEHKVTPEHVEHAGQEIVVTEDVETPEGSNFVCPAVGYYCKLCQKFYSDEVTAKIKHCKTKEHVEKFRRVNAVILRQEREEAARMKAHEEAEAALEASKASGASTVKDENGEQMDQDQSSNGEEEDNMENEEDEKDDTIEHLNEEIEQLRDNNEEEAPEPVESSPRGRPKRSTTAKK